MKARSLGKFGHSSTKRAKGRFILFGESRAPTALTAELKSKGFTALAIVDPQMHPPEELHAVLGLFDGEIAIYERETEKGSEKFLKIKRMANQKYLKDELLLKEKDMQK